jgi:nucleoside-diphosphate-sugar epimerase
VDEGIARRLSSRSAVPLLRQGDGEPFTDHVVASADAARAVIEAAAGAGSSGEAFNVAGPAPFSYEDWAPIVAGRQRRELVEVRAPSLRAYELSIDKARTQLSYEPEHGMEAMVASALASEGAGA